MNKTIKLSTERLNIGIFDLEFDRFFVFFKTFHQVVILATRLDIASHPLTHFFTKTLEFHKIMWYNIEKS